MDEALQNPINPTLPTMQFNTTLLHSCQINANNFWTPWIKCVRLQARAVITLLTWSGLCSWVCSTATQDKVQVFSVKCTFKQFEPALVCQTALKGFYCKSEERSMKSSGSHVVTFKLYPVMSLSGQVALWVMKAAGFEKDSLWTVYEQMKTKINAAEQRYHLFTPHIPLPFQNLVPTLPTMQRSPWVTSPQAVYQITCGFLWSHKGLYIAFSHMQ